MKLSLLSLLFLILALPAAAQNDRDIERVSLEKVNDIRKQALAKVLQRNARLDSAAAMQARWCAETGILSHTRPSGKYATPSDRLLRVKYKAAGNGENILFFMPDEEQDEASLAREIVQQWVDSPKHYANMRNKMFRDTGFAVAWSADGERLYACQVFGVEKVQKKGR